MYHVGGVADALPEVSVEVAAADDDADELDRSIVVAGDFDGCCFLVAAAYAPVAYFVCSSQNRQSPASSRKTI